MIIKKKFKQIETTEETKRISNCSKIIKESKLINHRSKMIKEPKLINHSVRGVIVYGNNNLIFQ